MNRYKNIISIFAISFLLILVACEDKEAEKKLIVENFNITLVDKITTGDGSQSQPELVRFITDTKGVIVNSKQNTVDFINITPTKLSMSGQSVQITNEADAECSSIDVSVDESILAVVVSKGACKRGELYLISTNDNKQYIMANSGISLSIM